MLNLLKNDLKRIVKDKLFIVICIIGGAFAIVTPSLYKLMFIGYEPGDFNSEIIHSMLYSLITARGIFFSSFSPTNNFALLLPIFIIIIIFKDFKHGTIRNKIIIGHSRTKIFISMFLSTVISIIGVILAYSFITLAYSLILFKYGLSFNSNEFLYLLESILFIILSYIFISAIVSFLCVYMKSSGVSIILFIAFGILMSFVPVILEATISVLKAENNTGTNIKILQFFIDINIFHYLSSVIGYSTRYEAKDVIYILISTIGFTALLITLGLLRFKKKDIK